MPCRSDYMERGRNEKEFQQTAINYQYALEAMGKTVLKTVKDSAKEYYCTTDFTRDLCELVRSMDSEQSNIIVFNGRDSRARQLADWWESHEEVLARTGRLGKNVEKSGMGFRLPDVTPRFLLRMLRDLFCLRVLPQHAVKCRLSCRTATNNQYG